MRTSKRIKHRVGNNYWIDRCPILDKGTEWSLCVQVRDAELAVIDVKEIMYGTKKACAAKMATLKRREFLSSISDVREAQRKALYD